MNVQITICHNICTIGFSLITVVTKGIDERVHIASGIQWALHQFVTDNIFL